MAAEKKYYLNDPLFIVAIVINLIFICNMIFAGWSLVWPTVSGTVTRADTKEFLIAARTYGPSSSHSRYSLVLTYNYQYGLTEHLCTVAMDTFDSKDLCNMAAERYQDKTVKVYINPFNHRISTIKPGDNFANSLICSILIAMLTGFLFFMKPYKNKDSA